MTSKRKQRLSIEQPTTPREKKFMKYLKESGKIGESALRAGFSHVSYGSFLLGQDRVRTALQKQLEEEGITDSFIAKKLKEQCEAVFPERKSKEGVTLIAEAPDYFSRDKGLDKVLKVRRDYLPEGTVDKSKTVNIVINMSMAEGLLDSKKITQAEFNELKELQHEPIRDEEDAGDKKV